MAAWIWFQVDYGTVWPAFGVLFFYTLAARLGALREYIPVWLALGASIAPFFFYYQLWGRQSVQSGTWETRFQGSVFNMNHYVLPMVVLVAGCVLLTWKWKQIAESERRLVVIGCGSLVALTLWVPTVAPEAFMRYVIMAVPLGSFVAAWVLVRGFAVRIPLLTWAGAAIFVATPWLSMPLDGLAPPWLRPDPIIRSELTTLVTEVFRTRDDPHCMVVEWLRKNAAPNDEILINYEDIPLMYYLPNPIRGGVAAFRAEDDSKVPPRFAVLRGSVPFVHWPVFLRQLKRYEWDDVPLKAPDLLWGNNPDPMGKLQDPASTGSLYVGRRRESKAP